MMSASEAVREREAIPRGDSHSDDRRWKMNSKDEKEEEDAEEEEEEEEEKKEEGRAAKLRNSHSSMIWKGDCRVQSRQQQYAAISHQFTRSLRTAST